MLVPRGIFDEFFSYEIAQVTGAMYGVLGSRWLGDVDIDAANPPSVVAATNFVVVGPGWLLSNHVVFFTLFLIGSS